jgi:hypothetical protein
MATVDTYIDGINVTQYVQSGSVTHRLNRPGADRGFYWWVGSIDNSESLDLNQILGLSERLHAYQGGGGLVVTEYRHPGLRNISQISGPVMDDVDRELGHLLGSGSRGGKAAAHVGERLAGLGSQITGTYNVALGVMGHLSGDEHQPAAGRGDDLRIARWRW